jgi:hypothetical protein
MQLKINEGDKEISFAFLGNTQIFPNVAFSEPTSTPTPTPTPTPLPPSVSLNSIGVNGNSVHFTGSASGANCTQKGFQWSTVSNFSSAVTYNAGAGEGSIDHYFTIPNGGPYYGRAFGTFTGVGTIYSDVQSGWCVPYPCGT